MNSSSKTYFITGATGFLGAYLVEELIRKTQAKNESLQIIALKRETSQLPKRLESFQNIIKWVNGDLFDVVFLNNVLKNVDVVIHGAAMVSFNPKDKKRMQKTNVIGTKNMVNAALENKVELFFQISSVAALGQPLPSQNIENLKSSLTFIDEKARWTPEYTGFSAYAYTKHLSELEVWRGIAEGLNALIINPSFVLGYEENMRSSTALIDYLLKENPYYGSGYSNFVDVRDVAEMSVELLKKSEQDTKILNQRYILNGGTVAYSELMPRMAKALNKKPPYKPIPSWIKKYGWQLAKIWSFVSGSNPIITKDSLEAADRKIRYGNQKIKKTLETDFRSLEETINWTAQKYSQN